MKSLWLLLFALLGVHEVWAWGSGHDDVQRAIMKRLPEELKVEDPAGIQKLLKASHYPDSFEPFETDLMGEEAVMRLHKQGIVKRYDLHTDKGRAMAFLELIRALREDHAERANFWIACLAHSAADAAALNHDPLGYTVNWSWRKQGVPMKTAQGAILGAELFDLTSVLQSASGRKLFESIIDGQSLNDEGSPLEEAVLQVMLYGYEGAAYCAPRGLPLLADLCQSAGSDIDSEETPRLRLMAELGAWPVIRILRDVQVARRLAATSVRLDLNADILERYQDAVKEHMSRTLLTNDALYRLPTSRQASETTPAIGVVVEPTWRMDDAFLGFAQRVLAVEIANTLYAEKKPFRLLDVRELLHQGFPASQLMPVIIIPATGPRNLPGLDLEDLSQELRKYLQQGGKVLWIGGGLPSASAFPEIRKNIVASGDKRWPLDIEELSRSRLTWGAKRWNFARPLSPDDHWQSPRFPYQVNSSGDGDFLELLTLERENGTPLAVGAAWPEKHPRFVLLPTFALWPFVFTTPDSLPDSVAEVTLDSVGTTVLREALRLLESPDQE